MSKRQFLGFYEDGFGYSDNPVYGDTPEKVMEALVDDDTDLDAVVILDITDCPRYVVKRETKIVPVAKKV